ncbi:hemerythrin domain-containing protein [Cereibacter azotoformans]|uniref:hemerythrin domain-containing protein n=1 Tax=Cereibacter azotoformans TaxID=43057 RepID=UPI000E35B2A5|nr:hemerythrin domain-containing protein [Cereibacter azotoformans]AXQ95765.1 hypothetical protein D0Z66_18785 [Cereibacter sphaeroides]UIJ32875.1 hemerythrin domain-containing protein [Cereibacter azotoformans]
MTTIRQLIESSPKRANELFARLVDTSETAIKTRDRLFSQLKDELELQARLEEQHLLPVLKKHKDTKGLVADALNDNRQTRELLAELERTPKESEAFGTKVAELRKAFQQHVRDDKKDFLPVVVKALSDEEASAVVGKIEDGKAKLEAEQRAEADERRADTRRQADEAEREKAGQAKAEQDEAARAKAETERSRKEAAAAEATPPAAARKADDGKGNRKEAPRQSESRDKAEAERPAAELVDAGEKVARMVMTAGAEGTRDLGKALRVASGADQPQEAAAKAESLVPGPSMMDLLGEQARHAMQVTVAVSTARSMNDIARAQGDFLTGSFQRMTQLNARYLSLLRDGMGFGAFLNPRH